MSSRIEQIIEEIEEYILTVVNFSHYLQQRLL